MATIFVKAICSSKTRGCHAIICFGKNLGKKPYWANIWNKCFGTFVVLHKQICTTNARAIFVDTSYAARLQNDGDLKFTSYCLHEDERANKANPSGESVGFV